MIKEFGLFLHQMGSAPADVGAIAPSGPILARKMASQINLSSGKVVEIGPGTGAITKHILAAGVAKKDLTLFEMNQNFCDLLQKKYPDLHIHCRMAQDMKELGISNLGAIISGLPLLNMPYDVQHSIASAAFAALKPNAPFIQFTYGTKPPLEQGVLDDLGLSWTKIRRVWLNFPPATIYTFRQSQR